MTERCACVAFDAFTCWASRYGIQPSEVAMDGGPCECSCHDTSDTDEPATSLQTIFGKSDPQGCKIVHTDCV